MSDDFLQLLKRDGFIRTTDARLKPLKGGVSSDIYCVEDGDRKCVVKRALEKLKVEADWFADVARNETERAYMDYVAQSHPSAVPSILGWGDGYFVMEYLGEGFLNWKEVMMGGRFEPGWAEMAGRFLGDIHRRSANDEDLAGRFNKREAFWQLRIEPYLVSTGEKHPALQDVFEEEANRLRKDASALVHGDFSPKNLLIGGDRLVVLDCEVACYADPAFDLAFLLTHLGLKALYHRQYFEELRCSIERFLGGYGALGKDLELRVVKLWLMLLLARVDGKSPVEYLQDPQEKAFVRNFVDRELRNHNPGIINLGDKWFEEVGAL